MIEELKQIREKLADAIEERDMLYAKMVLNRLDGLIYKLSMEGKKSAKTCGRCGGSGELAGGLVDCHVCNK